MMPPPMPPLAADLLQNVLHHAPAAAVLAAFVSLIASFHNPRLKALVYSLPVPFCCAYLATHKPVDATHMAGLGLIMGYNWSVYMIARRWRWPLGLAIALGVSGYVSAAVLLSHVVPLAAVPLPWAALAVLAFWATMVWRYRPIDEPGHRGAMPWWLKAPVVFIVGLVMYNLTGLMGGAVFTFPYAGVFTSYESRHSLRTLAGQFTINTLGIWSLVVTIWWTQSALPFPWPVLPGLGAMLLALALVHGLRLGRPDAADTD
jgi:hypothetical protein